MICATTTSAIRDKSPRTLYGTYINAFRSPPEGNTVPVRVRHLAQDDPELLRVVGVAVRHLQHLRRRSGLYTICADAEVAESDLGRGARALNGGERGDVARGTVARVRRLEGGPGDSR